MEDRDPLLAGAVGLPAVGGGARCERGGWPVGPIRTTSYDTPLAVVE